MSVRDDAKTMKLVAPRLAATSLETRNTALAAVAEALRANSDAIFAANEKDMAAAAESGVAPQVQKRLRFIQALTYLIFAVYTVARIYNVRDI